jgi:hypothetical protein
MFIASLAGDGAGVDLLVRVIALTLFYAGLTWLPLRCTLLVMKRAKWFARPKKPAPSPRPETEDGTWIIR